MTIVSATCVRSCRSCRCICRASWRRSSIIHERLPDVPQVAVFDTGFHRGHDELFQRLPIPEALHREGVLSYGFHGISYEFIAGRLKEIDPALAKGRVVVAHLGNGCSMCALVGGRSVEASWGFSALDGLPMGTRPGRLDPGVVLYLLQEKRMSVEQVQNLLYSECGLKGLSGVGSETFASSSASEVSRARLALELVSSLRWARMVAELATVMGGLDGLVFTAGIGEHAAPLRANIGSRLSWFGRRDRRGGQCPTRATHLLEREPRRLLCHRNERGAHDRPSCPGTGSPVSQNSHQS